VPHGLDLGRGTWKPLVSAQLDGNERSCLLHKPVASAPTSLFFLQLNKLELAERLKHILKIAFSNAEMDIAYIKTVEGNGVVIATGGFRVSCLSILFCFSKLRDDGDAQKLLASQLNRERDRFFLFKFNVANTSRC
jgi:hypothetical protein